MKCKSFVLMLLASTLMGCNTQNNPEKDTSEPDFRSNKDGVEIVPESQIAKKLKLEVVKSETLDIQFRTTALVKASRAPEFELSTGYSYNKEVRNEIAPAPKFHGLSVGVAVPLKFSRLNKGERLAAERSAQQAEALYEAAKQQIASEVQQALVSWQSATKVAQECSSAMLEDAASILENRRIAYMQGDSSLLDYLMAVRVYNDTAEQCIAAKAGLTTAAAELLRTIGL